MTPLRFRNRIEGGRELGRKLTRYSRPSDVLVLGLPRGGVLVAAEVARVLGVPFDVFVVRKLRVPGQEELALGAIAEGGVRVLSRSLIKDLAIPDRVIDEISVRERLELDRTAGAFRGQRPAPEVAGRVIILVDDGLATGASMEAAIAALRDRHPARIIVAVPVCARDACRRVAPLVDEVVAVSMPEPFDAVGAWYDDFSQATDEEVMRLLATRRARAAHAV